MSVSDGLEHPGLKLFREDLGVDLLSGHKEQLWKLSSTLHSWASTARTRLYFLLMILARAVDLG